MFFLVSRRKELDCFFQNEVVGLLNADLALLFLFIFSMARTYHSAWVPSSRPGSIVLLGGHEIGTRFNAEIIPGDPA